MKMTVKFFKDAMRADGNFKSSLKQLDYLTRAIDGEKRLTEKDKLTLQEWANTFFTNKKLNDESEVIMKDQALNALKSALHDLETSFGLMCCDNEEGHSLFSLEHPSIPIVRKAIESEATVKEPTMKEILFTADGITDKPIEFDYAGDEVSELLDLVMADGRIHDLDQYDQPSMQTTSGRTMLGLMQRLQKAEAAIHKALKDNSMNELKCHVIRYPNAA